MTYVMSDIHGQFFVYLEMLELIGLTEQDHLYIIGDVIDRGEHGILAVQYIMTQKNVTLLRGNHEQMMLDYLKAYNTPGANRFHVDGLHDLWVIGNWGEPTLAAYRALPPEEQAAIYQYLDSTPLEQHIVVDGVGFHLVHGYPSPEQDPEIMLWKRVGRRGIVYSPTGEIVVFGHTPTKHYQNCKPMKIFYSDSVIGIDCGCALGDEPGQLGCLQLDSLREYYVELVDHGE